MAEIPLADYFSSLCIHLQEIPTLARKIKVTLFQTLLGWKTIAFKKEPKRDTKISWKEYYLRDNFLERNFI